MDDKNIENWEQELKNQLSDHQEATDGKDLDAFMGKLDSNDFFEPSGKSFSGTLAFLTGVVITGVAIWIFSGEQTKDLQPEIYPIINTQTIETIQTNSEEIDAHPDSISTVDAEGINMSEDNSSTDPLIEEETLVVDKIDKKKIEKKKVTEKKKAVAAMVVSKKVADPDSSVNVPQEAPKTAPIPRKRIVIMSTDTTVVTDTTHVKHRKKEIRKNK